MIPFALHVYLVILASQVELLGPGGGEDITGSSSSHDHTGLGGPGEPQLALMPSSSLSSAPAAPAAASSAQVRS